MTCERFIPLLHQELREQALRHLNDERWDQTLSATVLVNEVYLRLAGEPIHCANRGHFYAMAARVLRQVLVEHARRHGAAQRGGGWTLVPLEGAGAKAFTSEPDLDLVVLDQAVEALAALDPRKARVVELRFFGGLTVDEAAETLGISASTVTREWRMARVWLRRWIAGREAEPPPKKPR